MVNLLIIVNVDKEGHVSWFALRRTGVRIVVIFRQEIDIVNNDTLVIVCQLGNGLVESDIGQQSAIKRLPFYTELEFIILNQLIT